VGQKDLTLIGEDFLYGNKKEERDISPGKATLFICKGKRPRSLIGGKGRAMFHREKKKNKKQFSPGKKGTGR